MGNMKLHIFFQMLNLKMKQTEISKATLKKNVICDEYSCIGYDTKLKKAVFLDKKDMRIIYPEW